jgi:hypothetical protein
LVFALRTKTLSDGFQMWFLLARRAKTRRAAMERQASRLRALLRDKVFLHMPSVYDARRGRLIQSLGYEAAYVGGYVTGGSRAATEPLLAITEPDQGDSYASG